MLAIFYWVLLLLIAVLGLVPVPDNSPWGSRVRFGNTLVLFALFVILGLRVFGMNL